MSLYTSCLRPFLFQLDPEQAHHLGIAGLRWGLASKPARAFTKAHLAVTHAALQQRLWGLELANPIGLAAGMDKHAAIIEPLAALGFGMVEVGTFTGKPQPGNPKPRSFRLRQDGGLINRMGLNNIGGEAAGRHLAAAYDPVGGQRRPGTVLAGSVGKTTGIDLADALPDYQATVAALADYCDLIVVNVSCPNVVGLTGLQAADALRPVLAGIRASLDAQASGRPLLLKLGPDLEPAVLDGTVDCALECGVDGLVATNTTTVRDHLRTTPERLGRIGNGGLSGAPLRARSTRVLAQVARRVDGRVPLVGVGGVDSVDAAWEKITHGASMVQVYTGFVYRGPGFIRELNRGLLAKLHQHGLRHISEAVGRDL